MMTTSEPYLRSIIGAARVNLEPLALSIDLTAKELFEQDIPPSILCVTNTVYPQVAELFVDEHGKHPKVTTVTRRIERSAQLCWKHVIARDLGETILGAPAPKTCAPREAIIYLAYYIFDKPYFLADAS